MIRPLGFGMLALLLTCAGCFTAAPPEAVPRAAAPTPAVNVKTYPPVTVDLITDRNGHQIAQSLQEEMDRDTQQK